MHQTTTYCRRVSLYSSSVRSDIASLSPESKVREVCTRQRYGEPVSWNNNNCRDCCEWFQSVIGEEVDVVTTPKVEEDIKITHTLQVRLHPPGSLLLSETGEE
ncbi:hypothetical protein quinque_008355 [Culex quinquefasciatus]